jgi:hypothetical protein
MSVLDRHAGQHPDRALGVGRVDPGGEARFGGIERACGQVHGMLREKLPQSLQFLPLHPSGEGRRDADAKRDVAPPVLWERAHPVGNAGHHRAVLEPARPAKAPIENPSVDSVHARVKLKLEAVPLPIHLAGPEA